MSQFETTDVLIVGAGSSGLATAIALASKGVRNLVIVDALATSKYGSRACVVHARTLEVLSTVDLAQPLIDEGYPTKGITFVGGTDSLIDVHVSTLWKETKYPMMLNISQDAIEKIFSEKLKREFGIEVRRGWLANSVRGVSDGSGRHEGIEVGFKNGSNIRARYIVGADGARSTIRGLTGIAFKDPKTGTAYDPEVPLLPNETLRFVLADMYFEEPLPSSLSRDVVTWHVDERFIMAPLPVGHGTDALTARAIEDKSVSLWRVGFVVSPGASRVPPRHPDIGYLQAELDARRPWKEQARIASVPTAATYRVRSAVAASLFKRICANGYVTLVGDAAHVHSPAGAQGMNLGLCDAVALGDAIHKHMKNTSGSPADHDQDSALRTYSDSRRAIAVTVIGFTQRLTNIINFGEHKGWRRIVRDTALWVLGRLPFFRRRLARRLAGLVYRTAL